MNRREFMRRIGKFVGVSAAGISLSKIQISTIAAGLSGFLSGCYDMSSDPISSIDFDCTEEYSCSTQHACTNQVFNCPGSKAFFCLDGFECPAAKKFMCNATFNCTAGYETHIQGNIV